MENNFDSSSQAASKVTSKRARLLEHLFPRGVPRLWCPPLTHYDGEGNIDCARIRAHLRHLSRHVQSFLIPGSTGDGWQMSPAEIRQLLAFALDEAQQLRLRLLVGLLKSDAQESLAALEEVSAWLKTRHPTAARGNPVTPQPAPAASPVCGFTFCAPRGRDRSSADIGQALASLLAAGFPTALYQLPQVTQNEISSELAAGLAARFPNFILFKDSSGADGILRSGKDLGGVFTLRGAEGDYARWLKLGGGPYDGWLLGSANCFAAELSELLEHLSAGRPEAADRLSARLTSAVTGAMQLVAGLPSGNAFANANKALDHFFAFGPRAAAAAPPRLHGGGQLPVPMIRAAGEILSRHGLMPAKGYLE